MDETRSLKKWLLPTVLTAVTVTNMFMMVAVGLLLGILFLCCDSRPVARRVALASLAAPVILSVELLTPVASFFVAVSALSGALALRKNWFSTVTSSALIASLIAAALSVALILNTAEIASWRQMEKEALALHEHWQKVASSDSESMEALARSSHIVVLLLPGQFILMMLASFFIAVLAFRTYGEYQVPLSLGCTHFQQYRFEDHWIWVVIAGLVLVLLTRNPGLHRVAANLLFVMGVLYVIRGLAVIFHFIAMRNGGLLMRILAVLLCLTPMCLFHLVFGLLDTWADFRKAVPADR
jgi:uncharacterized protein YybS (DUF2232 family)